MKRTIAAILAVLTMFMLCASCGKKEPKETDPNAVLTDSNVPLELGAVAPEK